MKPHLMSMEELDKVVRNPAFDYHQRQRCLVELKRRERGFFYAFVNAYPNELCQPHYAPGL